MTAKDLLGTDIHYPSPTVYAVRRADRRQGTVNEDYVEARVIEALDDLYLALLLWKEGRTRKAAGEAFSAVKALLSALVVVNEEKLAELAKDEKEREWIKKRAHTVLTHSMYEWAQALSDIR